MARLRVQVLQIGVAVQHPRDVRAPKIDLDQVSSIIARC